MMNNGVTWESCWPYECRNANCNERCTDWDFVQQKIQSYTRIPYGEVEMRRNALANKEGILISPMKIYGDFQYYRGGVYECDENSGYQGMTVVNVIGYDIPENYWIVRNVWGTGWGEQGYMRVRHGGADEVGMYECFYVAVLEIANHLWYLEPKGGHYY